MTTEEKYKKCLQAIADMPIVYPYELTEYVRKVLNNES